MNSLAHRQTEKHANQAQAGFLLWEVLIAVSIMSLVFWGVSGGVSQITAMVSNLNRMANLASIEQGLKTAYDENANLVESFAGAVITLPDMNGDGNNETIVSGIATETTFAPINRYLTSGAGGTIFDDGKGRPAQVFVSNQLSSTVDGATVNYHVMAVVMPGAYQTNADPAMRGTADVGCTTNRANYVCSTFNAATGQLNYSTEDGGAVIISGLDVQKTKFTELKAKLDRLAAAYETYFTMRYYADSARNYNNDYFAAGAANWDPAVCGTSIVCIANNTTITTTGGNAFGQAMGLTTNDLTTPWGGTFSLDNASNAVRSPNNANALLTSAPFTARITANIPGGTYVKTVIGKY